MRKKNNQFNGYLYKQSSSIEILQKKDIFFNTCGLCYRHPFFSFKKTETKIIKGLIKDDEIRIIREHVVYFTVLNPLNSEFKNTNVGGKTGLNLF